MGQPQHIARLLDTTQEVLEKIKGENASTAMLRGLHTQKGIARGLGLKALSQDLHDLETILQPMTGHSIGHSLNDHLKGIQERLLEYRAIAEVLKNSRTMSTALGSNLAATLQAHIPAWVEQMQKGGQVLNNLCINDGVLTWNSDNLQIMEQVCIHAVNNSIDHGFLESDLPVDQAEIEISVVKKQGFIHLSISDNGQGLDLDRLGQLASARGFVPKGDETIADVVFCDGLSLAKSLSISSGRGVGLAAVKELIEENGGEVHLQNRLQAKGSILKAFWPEVRNPAQATG